MDAHNTDNTVAVEDKKAKTKRHERIAFVVIWFIIAAVIAVPACLAGASPTVGIISGVVAGFVFSWIGKFLSRFNLPSL